MFSKLVAGNSKRNRKDSVLYFSSMVISIIAFYIVLSLSNQDVMIFLRKMESDAVNRLMGIIPVFYLVSLFILFFLVYFAESIQIERRKHEFGVYLTLGMKRSRLFSMLLLEDLRNNAIALAIGLPIAILLSELISLVTAKVVGLGVIGHRFSLLPIAIVFTVVGFLLVKFIAFLFLSFKVTSKEIGELLTYSPSGVKRQLPKIIYVILMILGAMMLVNAYQLGISGYAWRGIKSMGITVFLGGAGTILVFFGARIVMGFMAGTGSRNKKKLHTFNFRQIQELVINRSTTIAVCSLLIFAALCLSGTGVTVSTRASGDDNVLDYTFRNEVSEENLTTAQVRKILRDGKIESAFSNIVEVKIGYPKERNSLFLDNLTEQIERFDYTDERGTLLRNLEATRDCHLISLSGYNELRRAANMQPFVLGDGEAILYMHKDFLLDEKLLNSIVKTNPTIGISGDKLTLVEQVESMPIVTDREITLSFALIVDDSNFETYTDKYSSYVSGILSPEFVEEKGLMQAIMETNDILDKMPIGYESYLQNMGRQLFYVVAASYLTLYLALIFLVVANTIIGVQFLMGQRKTQRRYQTLVHLGATYETLCQSARKQINWYYGLPIVVAAINSYFGIQSLLPALTPFGAKIDLRQEIFITCFVVIVLVVFEYIYMVIVKKGSDKFLWKLMSPKRQE